MGDGVKLFQPPDVDDLVAQLTPLIDDVQARHEWAGRGVEGVQRFTSDNQYRALREALNGR